jgi:hypothetical protein
LGRARVAASLGGKLDSSNETNRLYALKKIQIIKKIKINSINIFI